jgi:pyridoxine 5-phosphate synthase
VIALAKFVPRLNLEMATSEEILQIACELKPQFCCLVPEKRAELTTEGGLDVANNLAKIKTFTHKLNLAGILVSLFIEADSAQILKAKEAGAQYIEIHTGKYANTQDAAQQQELAKIKAAVEYAEQLGLKVNAGHGLKYYNTAPIAAIKTIEELNIGHSIISRAVFVGLKSAVEEMKRIML